MLQELTQALRTRKVSAAELVAQAIERIETLDKALNAVVVRNFAGAREAAKAADAALVRGEQQPLLGIPITIKEAFNLAGLPTTWGNPQFKDFVPREDAVAVARLKRAGAIIVGKTNVPFQLADIQSYNEVYGTTNNPWDVARTPGGSSGGSAAALAAGFTPLSLGSDLGGSLRIPAHFCGVFAHKPSLGLVPERGHTPPGVTPIVRDPDLVVIGPMARTARDLALALDVLAGPDEARAGIGYRLALRPPRHDDLKSFRVLVLETHPLMPTGALVRTALAKVSERLARSGVRLSHSSPLLPDLAASARTFMRLWSAFRGAFAPASLYEDMRRVAQALAANDDRLLAERARGAVMSYRDWVAADAARARLRQQWGQLFQAWDVVICPVMATAATPHDHSQPIEARMLEIDGKVYPFRDTYLVWSELATSAGLPATTVPIAGAERSLPVGVQIVGPYLEDRTTLRFAELMEREFGGFVAPPGYAA
jgi:amidase